MTAKKLVNLIILMLIIGGLTLILVTWLDNLGHAGQIVNYENLDMAGLEIKGDFILGQTFLAPRNGLHRIDVILRTYERRNMHDVTFYLKQSPDSPEILYQETFNAVTVGNNRWRRFEFPPIPDSAGKTYFFYLASPDSVAGDAISVGGATGDFYDDGITHLAVGPAQGDLAFRTYYNLSPGEKLAMLGQRLVEDKSSIWGSINFYILLLALYILILLRIFVEIFKETSR